MSQPTPFRVGFLAVERESLYRVCQLRDRFGDTSIFSRSWYRMVVVPACAFFFGCRCRVGEKKVVGKDDGDCDSACDEHVPLIHHVGSSVGVFEA